MPDGSWYEAARPVKINLHMFKRYNKRSVTAGMEIGVSALCMVPGLLLEDWQQQARLTVIA